MPYPRYKQIDLQQTQYYHVISRCVRRSYLCGLDHETGESYEHRKGWVEQRLLHLTKVFTIDVLAYAIMSNHYHVVVEVDDNKAGKLSDLDVVERWHTISSGTAETEEFLKSGILPSCENNRRKLHLTINEYRKRLCSLSWFMKLLNQYIAKQANKEDDCTGHFWEGRFKSQALLGISAVISCMVYVDLNPFRAGVVTRPEYAKHTSLYKRVKALKRRIQPRFLMPFSESQLNSEHKSIPYSLEDYLRLVENTAALSCKSSDAYLSKKAENSIQNLGFCPSYWETFMTKYEELFPVALGSSEHIERFKQATGRTRMKAGQNSLKLYLSLGHKTH